MTQTNISDEIDEALIEAGYFSCRAIRELLAKHGFSIVRADETREAGLRFALQTRAEISRAKAPFADRRNPAASDNGS